MGTGAGAGAGVGTGPGAGAGVVEGAGALAFPDENDRLAEIEEERAALTTMLNLFDALKTPLSSS